MANCSRVALVFGLEKKQKSWCVLSGMGSNRFIVSRKSRVGHTKPEFGKLFLSHGFLPSNTPIRKLHGNRVLVLAISHNV